MSLSMAFFFNTLFYIFLKRIQRLNMQKNDWSKISLMVTIIFLIGGFVYALYAIPTLKTQPVVITSSSSANIAMTADSIKTLLANALKTDSTWGEPVVSQVSDVEKVKQSDSVFFETVEKGDWFLLYPTKKKAVLYRESNNQIIKYGDTK